VVRVFTENDTSATNGTRPKYKAMMEMVERGDAEVIVAWHVDRLTRKLTELEQIIELAERTKVKIATVSGDLDLSNDGGRLVGRILASVARGEVERKSARQKAANQQKAEKGEAIGGGKRPYGFGVPTGETGRTGQPTYDTTKLVPEEAQFLREAVERLLGGQTQASVVRWLNEVSVTSQGNRWTSKSLQNLLKSPRIAGLISYEGQLYDAEWPGIISEDQWEAVNALMERRAIENPYPGRARRYLLTGVAECSECGSTLRCKPSGGKNRKTARLYYCHECRKVARNVERLDAYVVGRVLHLLNDPRLIEELSNVASDPGLGAEIALLQQRKADAKEHLENLADHPTLSADVIVRAMESFDKRIEELRERIARTVEERAVIQAAGFTKEQWDDTAIDVKSVVVKALFRVIVKPTMKRGPGFDESAVRMERRR